MPMPKVVPHGHRLQKEIVEGHEASAEERDAIRVVKLAREQARGKKYKGSPV
jgi:hypothetical protein